MNQIFLVLITSFILFFSTPTFAETSSEESLKAKLHGLWAEFHLENGEILSYMHYIPEGKFHAYGYLEENKEEFWFAFGNWEVKDNQSCIVFLFDTYRVMANAGEICVTVLSVTEDTFIYKDNQDGATETLKRVSDGFLQ